MNHAIYDEKKISASKTKKTNIANKQKTMTPAYLPESLLSMHASNKPMPLQEKHPISYVVQRKPTPMRTAKDFREYVTLEDKKKISRYCEEKHYAISFRKAGKYTIHKLMQGAAAKGHHILEKSIKESSVGSDISMKNMPEQLKGLVGHWDSSGNSRDIMRLQGLYLSRAGLQRLEIEEQRMNGLITQVSEEGEGAKQIMSLDDLVSLLLRMKKKVGTAPNPNNFSNIEFPEGIDSEAERTNYKTQLAKLHFIARNIGVTRRKRKPALEYRDFVTGDYDMHDLAYVSENPTTRGAVIIPSHAVKEGLNAALNGRTRPHSEFDRIQHGPQVDYRNYIQAHPKERMIPSLMEIDTPVAMCGPDGKWVRLDSAADVREYYESLTLNSQLFWPSDDEFDLRLTTTQILRGERPAGT